MNESDKNLINQLLSLLDRIEEEFFYNREKLESLDRAESVKALEDIKEALDSVDKSLDSLGGEIDMSKIKSKGKDMKKELDSAISDYRDNEGKKSSDIMDLWLMPSFRNWKNEVKETLEPYIS